MYHKYEHHELTETWYIFGWSVSTLMFSRRKQQRKSITIAFDKKEDKCPLVLAGITFDVYSEYIFSLKNTRKPNKPNSVSLYQGNRSKLANIFSMSKHRITDKFKEELTNLFKVLTWKVSMFLAIIPQQIKYLTIFILTLLKVQSIALIFIMKEQSRWHEGVQVNVLFVFAKK